MGIEVDGTTTLPTGGGGGLVGPPETRNLGLPETNTPSVSKLSNLLRKKKRFNHFQIVLYLAKSQTPEQQWDFVQRLKKKRLM